MLSENHINLDPKKSLKENGVQDGSKLIVSNPAPAPAPAPEPVLGMINLAIVEEMKDGGKKIEISVDPKITTFDEVLIGIQRDPLNYRFINFLGHDYPGNALLVTQNVTEGTKLFLKHIGIGGFSI